MDTQPGLSSRNQFVAGLEVDDGLFEVVHD